MPSQGSASDEIVDYRRSASLPGVEVINAQHSPREWRVISAHCAVVMFRTWRGSVRHRGGVYTGEPGLAFCSTPGEAMVARPLAGPGSFSVLHLAPELVEQWLSEQQPSSLRFAWAEVVKPTSPQFRQHFWGFFDSFVPAASSMQVQSQLLDLSGLMIGELIQGARQPRPVAGPPLRAAARMRECLNEEGLHLDLEKLAKRAGLSRFEALRAFKRRYGLPPHAYQLCLRIEHARRLLIEGAPAADVALRCGFADQSHFNRHFKRFNGVTPLQYARGRTRSTPSIDHLATGDSSAIILRSDR